MANLPFVVQPRLAPVIELIGSEESGKIEIERRGYLTSGEKAFVQQVLQHDNGTSELIALARKVSRRLSLKLDEAYELVLKVISGNGESEGEKATVIEDEFAEEVSVVIKNLTNAQTKEELLTATCLIRYRIDPNFEMDDIIQLHPDIISGLAKLYKEEDAKSVEKLEAQKAGEGAVEESVEELEKKPARRTPKKI